MSAAQKSFVWEQLDFQMGSSSIVFIAFVQKLRPEPSRSYIFALFDLLLIVHQANATHWLHSISFSLNKMTFENNRTLTQTETEALNPTRNSTSQHSNTVVHTGQMLPLLYSLADVKHLTISLIYIFYLGPPMSFHRVALILMHN